MAKQKNNNESGTVKKESPKEARSRKFFVKESKDLGFEKRTFFIPGINKKVIIIAGAEIDESTYNLFPERCKQVFFK